MNEEEFDDYYQLLRIAEDATTVDVTRAYTHAMRYWHPDTLASRPLKYQEEAVQVTVKLNQAVEILSDPVRRTIYDALLTDWRSHSGPDGSVESAPLSRSGENDWTMEVSKAVADRLGTSIPDDRLIEQWDHVGSFYKELSDTLLNAAVGSCESLCLTTKGAFPGVVTHTLTWLGPPPARKMRIKFDSLVERVSWGLWSSERGYGWEPWWLLEDCRTLFPLHAQFMVNDLISHGELPFLFSKERRARR